MTKEISESGKGALAGLALLLAVPAAAYYLYQYQDVASEVPVQTKMYNTAVIETQMKQVGYFDRLLLLQTLPVSATEAIPFNASDLGKQDLARPE